MSRWPWDLSRLSRLDTTFALAYRFKVVMWAWQSCVRQINCANFYPLEQVVGVLALIDEEETDWKVKYEEILVPRISMSMPMAWTFHRSEVVGDAKYTITTGACLEQTSSNVRQDQWRWGSKLLRIAVDTFVAPSLQLLRCYVAMGAECI